MKRKRLILLVLAAVLMLAGCSSGYTYDDGCIKFNYDDSEWYLAGESETDWYKIITLTDEDDGRTVRVLYGDKGHLSTSGPKSFIKKQMAADQAKGNQVSDLSTDEVRFGLRKITAYEYDTSLEGFKRFLFIKNDHGEIRIEETSPTKDDSAGEIEESVSYYKN